MNAWDNEPDDKDFEHKGLPCRLHRNRMKAWCGYVGIPKGHPWHGKSYSDSVGVPQSVIDRDLNIDKIGVIDLFCANRSQMKDGRLDICLAIDVHGGLTFSDDHSAMSDPDGLWWFGFDCSHAGDLCPGLDDYGMPDGSDIYRDIHYVTKECEALAEQLTSVALAANNESN